MNRDHPARIDRLLDGILAEIGLARPVDVAYLVEHWGEVAGEPWAKRSRPARLDAGELTVEAFDATAASLLRYQSSALIERLETVLGKGLVASIVVVRRSG